MNIERIGKFLAAATVAISLAGCAASLPHGGATRFASHTDIADVRSAVFMQTGEQVVAPFGFIAFCASHKPDCEGGSETPSRVKLDAARWQELNDVNDYVNRNVRQVEDRDNYGRNELWTYPNATGGDCEDMALEKRKLLISRGWAPENVLIATARTWNGEGHAVLIVAADRGEFVLDNKNWAIVSWKDAPYQWDKRQSRQKPTMWVNLDAHSFKKLAVDQANAKPLS